MKAKRALVAGAASLTLAALGGGMAEANHQFSQFQPLSSSATCSAAGGNADDPLALPSGFSQNVIAAEPQFPDLIDQNTVNETGTDSGRFLYRTHESLTGNASVSVTDLSTVAHETSQESQTGDTTVIAVRADWERLDGIRWTPWGSLIFGEEVDPAVLLDPEVPQATAGLTYELDLDTGVTTARPAIGARAHEGMDFYAGKLYGISEKDPGYIYKFVPDAARDLSSGRLFALKITNPNGDRVGEAAWVPLDRTQVQVNSDEVAEDAGATSYARPEDVEVGGGRLYVAITDEARVLAVNLTLGGRKAFVSQYVKASVNAPSDFFKPDNLVRDKDGNLYITEDPGGFFVEGKTAGDDIWVARPSASPKVASRTVRFASLTDCDAEPTGIYFAPGDPARLYVNIQHRGGDSLDKALVITKS